MKFVVLLSNYVLVFRVPETEMGRKLNPLETFDLDAAGGRPTKNRLEDTVGLSDRLQARIADALGVPVEAFSQPEQIGIDQYEAQQLIRHPSQAMSEDCSALLRAFTSIKDPDERDRLLKIVQEAAQKR
jgi:hypothetical protein